jgi:hypothetical protein
MQKPQRSQQHMDFLHETQLHKEKQTKLDTTLQRAAFKRIWGVVATCQANRAGEANLRDKSHHSAGETVGGSPQGCACLRDGKRNVVLLTLLEVELTNTRCLSDLT